MLLLLIQFRCGERRLDWKANGAVVKGREGRRATCGLCGNGEAYEKTKISQSEQITEGLRYKISWKKPMMMLYNPHPD